MFDAHEVHWYERDYVRRVINYLRDHFGKTLDDLSIEPKEIVKGGMQQNLHPSEFIENNQKEWGIHRLPSSIPGTAKRIVAIQK